MFDGDFLQSGSNIARRGWPREVIALNAILKSGTSYFPCPFPVAAFTLFLYIHFFFFLRFRLFSGSKKGLSTRDKEEKFSKVEEKLI